MGFARGFPAAVLLLLPIFAQPALATVSYSLSTVDEGYGATSEFLLGDLVRFRVFITSIDETFSLTKTLHLYRFGTYERSIGPGDVVSISPGPTTVFYVDWDTNAGPLPSAGKWRADLPTPHGTRSVTFDLGWTPDFQLEHVQVSEGKVMGQWNVYDGTQKTVRGCVRNVGPETASSVEVALYHRTAIDGAFTGAKVGNLATPDFTPGHVLAVQTIPLSTALTYLCTSKGIAKPGFFVEFTWDVDSDLETLGLLHNEVGLRADPDDDVLETNEANNEKETGANALPKPMGQILA